jgi:hypothetical protein
VASVGSATYLFKRQPIGIQISVRTGAPSRRADCEYCIERYASIGMLIVDPLTGAMFNLTPEKIEQPMSPAQAQLIRSGQGLLIVLTSETTQQERNDMVRVN